MEGGGRAMRKPLSASRKLASAQKHKKPRSTVRLLITIFSRLPSTAYSSIQIIVRMLQISVMNRRIIKKEGTENKYTKKEERRDEKLKNADRNRTMIEKNESMGTTE